MSEAARIADQLSRAFAGDAWHGDSLFEILEGVTAAQAAARPIKNAHTIWKLVLHIAAWDNAVLRRLGGVAVTLSDAQNFPPVTDATETAWRKTLAEVRRVHEELVEAVSVLPDSRLGEIVPGEQRAHCTFYYMLHGVARSPTVSPAVRRANKNTLFLSFPQELSPLHSFYTAHPHFAVALFFPLPQSACSQKREMF